MSHLPADPRILEHWILQSALKSSLAPPQRKTLLALFAAHPEVAWRALDRTVLPPRLEPSDDPLVRTLRRLIDHDTHGLDGPALLAFEQAHREPDGFTRLLGIESQIAVEEKAGVSFEPKASPQRVSLGCGPFWLLATVCAGFFAT